MDILFFEISKFLYNVRFVAVGYDDTQTGSVKVATPNDLRRWRWPRRWGHVKNIIRKDYSAYLEKYVYVIYHVNNGWLQMNF